MNLSLSINEKILYGLDVGKLAGIEIGPLASPVVSKETGQVDYVDRATTEEIKKWYSKAEAVAQDQIVPIDYVWGDQTLAEATGAEENYDYCIAAHVIEHVPDLIGWLKEISSILCVGGIASFAIPDRRFTFDFLRPPSVPADLIDAYLRKLRKPSVRHIFDHFSSFAEIDIEDVWSADFDPQTIKPANDPNRAYTACLNAVENDIYIDSHCWVFTVESFLRLLEVLSRLNLLDFRIQRFFEVEKYMFEFVVQLEKLPTDSKPVDKHELFVSSLIKAQSHIVSVCFESSRSGEAQLYYDTGRGFNEQESVSIPFAAENRVIELEFSVPPVSLKRLRFDPISGPCDVKIRRIDVLIFGENRVSVPFECLNPEIDIKKTRITSDYFFARSIRNTCDPAIGIDLPARVIKET